MAAGALAWTDGVDCTGSEVENDTTGLLYVFDSSGIDTGCDELNDLGNTISTAK